MEEILYLLSFYFLEISMSAKDSCAIRQIVWFGIYKVTKCWRFSSLEIPGPIVCSGLPSSDCNLTTTGKNMACCNSEDSVRHVLEPQYQ